MQEGDAEFGLWDAELQCSVRTNCTDLKGYDYILGFFMELQARQERWFPLFEQGSRFFKWIVCVFLRCQFNRRQHYGIHLIRRSSA